MGVLQSYALYALAHVKEILHREIVFLLLQRSELTHLRQPLVDLAGIGRKGYFVNLLFAQRA